MSTSAKTNNQLRDDLTTIEFHHYLNDLRAVKEINISRPAERIHLFAHDNPVRYNKFTSNIFEHVEKMLQNGIDQKSTPPIFLSLSNWRNEIESEENIFDILYDSLSFVEGSAEKRNGKLRGKIMFSFYEEDASNPHKQTLALEYFLDEVFIKANIDFSFKKIELEIRNCNSAHQGKLPYLKESFKHQYKEILEMLMPLIILAKKSLFTYSKLTIVNQLPEHSSPTL